MLLSVCVVTVDGGKHPAEVRFPAPYGDRAAFEAEFRLSSAALDVAIRQMVKGASDDPSFAAALALHDRWLAFLAWRVLRRADPAVPAEFARFEDTIEEVAVLDVTLGDGTEDPTGKGPGRAPAPPPG